MPASNGNGTKRQESIVVRSWPKVVFFWPTAVASFICYLIGGGWWASAEATGQLASGIGLWWIIIFGLNMLVFTYDFGRANFITLVVAVAATVLGITAWDQASEVAIWGEIYGFFANLGVKVSPSFFMCMAVLFFTLLLLGFIRSRFDYWVISPNEVLHKHGLLGDVRRYATINMKVEKEIPDVFEWVLFGSGKLIFKPGGGRNTLDEVLVVDCVFRINTVEKKVTEFLRYMKVDEKEP